MKVTIWHNPNCGTSNKVLDFLKSEPLEVEVRDYIKNPPSVSELETVLAQLGERPDYILRKNDKVFKEKFEGISCSDAQWIQHMSANPSIIQRPIVIVSDKAYLARPADEFIMEFQSF